MERKALDALDNKIIRLLGEDGRMSVGDMAEKLGVTAPTVRSRIKSLEENGMLKIYGLIDPYQHQGLTTALVGMNIRSYGKLDQILEKVANLDNVVWAGVVTGRYDILAEVVFTGGTAELYKFSVETISKIGNVKNSETFVMMKSRNRWVRLPEGVEDI